MKKHGDEIFFKTFLWLQENYTKFQFYVERDVVWTIQSKLIHQTKESNLPVRIFNDYGILPGNRRHLSADLVILSTAGDIDVALEFKYEPSHNRVDIPNKKFPVVTWGKGGVGKDIQRIHQFVEIGEVRKAYSIFVDEGGYFKDRPPYPNSKWISWNNGVWVHWSEYPLK